MVPSGTPMPSIAETVVEMTEWVFPEHAGAPGQIHGGRMMEWITHAGTIAASRVARGTVALGAMDDIDFLHPLVAGALARREQLLARFAREAEKLKEAAEEVEVFRVKFESSRIVRPNEVLFQDFMFAGKLLFDIDEAGGILAVRYTRGFTMTACLDAMDFYSPA